MTHAIRTIFAVALAVAALGAASAEARGWHHRGHGYRHHHHHHHGHYYGYAAVPFAFFLGWGLNESLRPDPYYRPYRRGAYGCHFVIRDTQDRYGRAVRLGGTKCYDEYGNPYIVPGSPHVLFYH